MANARSRDDGAFGRGARIRIAGRARGLAASERPGTEGENDHTKAKAARRDEGSSMPMSRARLRFQLAAEEKLELSEVGEVDILVAVHVETGARVTDGDTRRV